MTIYLNPSRILHNPSRGCEGFDRETRNNPKNEPNPSQSFTGSCEGFVKDFKSYKYSKKNTFYYLYINPSRVHAHPRARRVRACARGDVKDLREGFQKGA